MGHLGTQNRDHSFKLFTVLILPSRMLGTERPDRLSVEDTLIKKQNKTPKTFLRLFLKYYTRKWTRS